MLISFQIPQYVAYVCVHMCVCWHMGVFPYYDIRMCVCVCSHMCALPYDCVSDCVCDFICSLGYLRKKKLGCLEGEQIQSEHPPVKKSSIVIIINFLDIVL